MIWLSRVVYRLNTSYDYKTKKNNKVDEARKKEQMFGDVWNDIKAKRGLIVENECSTNFLFGSKFLLKPSYL